MVDITVKAKVIDCIGVLRISRIGISLYNRGGYALLLRRAMEQGQAVSLLFKSWVGIDRQAVNCRIRLYPACFLLDDMAELMGEEVRLTGAKVYLASLRIGQRFYLPWPS